MEAQPLRVGFLVTPDNVADFFAMMERGLATRLVDPGER
jgi:hypothetical protein